MPAGLITGNHFSIETRAVLPTALVAEAFHAAGPAPPKSSGRRHCCASQQNPFGHVSVGSGALILARGPDVRCHPVCVRNYGHRFARARSKLHQQLLAARFAHNRGLALTATVSKLRAPIVFTARFGRLAHTFGGRYIHRQIAAMLGGFPLLQRCPGKMVEVANLLYCLG